MKTAESEIVEYLYEYMIKRAIPVSEMPRTFRVFCDKVLNNVFTAASTATLAYNRKEFEEVIRTLISFEKNSMRPYTPNDMAPPSVTDISPKYGCHNYHTLFTWYEFLQEVPNDFIITLNIQAVQSLQPDQIYKNVRPIEFRIWIEGLTLMNSDKQFNGVETGRIRDEWHYIRRKKGYADDFTRYINAQLETDRNLDNLIFAILYTPTKQDEIE